VDEAIKAMNAIGVLQVVEVDRSLVDAAVEAHRAHQISYWDRLIIAAAQRAGCKRVLSEDLNDGQRYGEVVVENPFRRA